MERSKLELILYKFMADKSVEGAIGAIIELNVNEVDSVRRNAGNGIGHFIESVSEKNRYGEENKEYISDEEQRLNAITTFIKGYNSGR